MYRMRKKNVFYKHVWSYPDKETLNYITELIETGKIKAIVDREFAFDRAVEALSYLQTNRAKGKVIVVINKK